ncbi:MAG TPA: DUF6084 family protein [Thermoanaerobaculia bacterium]|jgi:hypothetical protein|nr:DUF6084 family protein [Thermoanaerobaculia bacterium]
MSNLRFSVEGAEPVSYAASPLLGFLLRISNDDPVRNIVLQVQIRIEPVQRRYTPAEQAKLYELFGEPSHWGRSVRSMLWTNLTTVVKPFTGSTTTELHVPCSFDFNVGVTKYFHGLEDGEIPLTFLFSGSVFYTDANGALQLMQVSWESEARYRLPLDAWKRMMDLHYPNAAWLCVRRDLFDRLLEFKRERAIPTWEQTLEQVLDGARA